MREGLRKKKSKFGLGGEETDALMRREEAK